MRLFRIDEFLLGIRSALGSWKEFLLLEIGPSERSSPFKNSRLESRWVDARFGAMIRSGLILLERLFGT